MVEKNKLDEDLQRAPIDATLYHDMIGYFMYLTSSRPNLIYAVFLCARYQAKPTEKHLNAVKWIFRYLKGAINMVRRDRDDTRRRLRRLESYVERHLGIGDNGKDSLKFTHLNFKGTEGVVRLIRWFKKMETVFHISNCPEKYQVKYATCTPLNSALTWWNSHKRTIGTEAAFACPWREAHIS
ncbi:hypothetical protein Tco_0894719 [Tanacetum coccineum]|uniref:Reverse transcriptase Ty1/copia-type domain-containing protein n=1 Tax=Tanacetum coccineum TaxID=301880 RepID=A0ABQ5CFD1_9ASTR